MTRGRRTSILFALGSGAIFCGCSLISTAAINGLLGDNPLLPIALIFGLFWLFGALEDWADRQQERDGARLKRELAARRTARRKAAIRKALKSERDKSKSQTKKQKGAWIN